MTNPTATETAPTLTDAQRAGMLADIARWGWTSCPCCGWMGLTMTKAGKLRKHGRAQTGNGGLGCRGSGARIK